MSLKSLPCYTIVCDWPDCDADALASNEYSGFGEIDYVIECAEDEGWRIGRDAESHYCDLHPCAWASDPEQVDAMIPPFLLIHDGDTDDPSEDDGKVSLVLAETERLLAEGNEPLPVEVSP